MRKGRKRYSIEFKLEALRLLDGGALSICEVARDLAIHANTLRAWKEKYSDQTPMILSGHGGLPDAETENRRLRRENAILKQERDFLKKAATFFAKESE
jgi:transposase